MKKTNEEIILIDEDEKFQYAKASKIINLSDYVLMRTLEAFKHTYYDLIDDVSEKLDEFIEYMSNNVEFMAYCPNNWDYVETEYEQTVYMERKLKYKE